MNEEKDDDKSDNSAFNGALQTLFRIDELIRHISIYSVNDHIVALKKNLSELLIETQGFLSKPEYIKAWKDWEYIETKKLSFDKKGNIDYDSELPNLLFKFSAWLRYKLHKHEVTMASKKDFLNGLQRLNQRYRI